MATATGAETGASVDVKRIRMKAFVKAVLTLATACNVKGGGDRHPQVCETAPMNFRILASALLLPLLLLLFGRAGTARCAAGHFRPPATTTTATAHWFIRATPPSNPVTSTCVSLPCLCQRHDLRFEATMRNL